MADPDIERFPVRVTLRDGSPCSIRPLQESDESAFREFHKAIPEREQLFVRNEIADGSLFHRWIADSEFNATLPLIAFVDGSMAGLATLQLRNGGWKHHIGKLALLTHPDFHNLGIVDKLVAEIVTSAKNNGLLRLESELNRDREKAIKALAEAGFEQFLRLTDYIQDMRGNFHDYVLMGTSLRASFENLGLGD